MSKAAHTKFTTVKLTRMFSYLDRLRDSGKTNMFGAAPYVANAFNLPINDAREVLGMWRRTFSDAPAIERANSAATRA